MLASKIFLERSKASNVSCKGETMNSFGGIELDVSCGVCWIGGTVLGNGDDFFSSAFGEVAEEEGHPSQLSWQQCV